MDGLVMTGQLLLGLSILIILHEAGHFLAARAFGIRVEKFYLFFDAWGFKLVSFNYKGCEYGIGWLPLGGYVKISGMIDESMDTEQLSGPPQPWEFRSKPAWQRLIVMLGGVTVNIVLGIFIFWMLTLSNGETFVPNDKIPYGIAPGIIGREIGLQNGDRITEVNGKPVKRFEELTSSKVLLGNTELTVKRGEETKNIHVPGDVLEKVSDLGIGQFVEPRVKISGISMVEPGGNAEKAGVKLGDSILAINNTPVTFYDEFKQIVVANKGKQVAITVARDNKTVQIPTKVTPEGTVGVYIPLYHDIPLETVEYGFLESLPVGASRAWGSFMDNAKGLGKVASGQVKANKAFTGPIGIATMFGSTVNWVKFWSLVGLLSMALALMNLLPIPALDGGHAIFLLIEMVKGKPLGDKFMERAQMVGFVILITLMVFVFGNDIIKHVIN
ncbi:RIP metalloprotease RseP [Daejeonella lutea]|uniref:Zinc metalloprotease n=1 Tax=Daejeonella lutea TaxID=572036 RepID=A0A1T5EX02_9SPHI|nr:RIP metalloprotease RseP [Daejeonella lutea]SKB88446.1 regulator of sigma E protease [Daejeonella lutea]